MGNDHLSSENVRALEEPQTTTAIASKRGLSREKGRGKGRGKGRRGRMEERREKRKKTKPRAYRISPGRVIFLSWMLR